MTLKNLMKSEVVTILKSNTLKEAAQKMREFHVGNLVVIESEALRKPIGILTDRDIVVSTVALGLNPIDFNVEDIMSEDLVTARDSEGLLDLAKKMKQGGVRRVPIIDSEDRLSGILSSQDLSGLLAEELKLLGQIQKKQRKIEIKKRKQIN